MAPVLMLASDRAVDIDISIALGLPALRCVETVGLIYLSLT